MQAICSVIGPDAGDGLLIFVISQAAGGNVVFTCQFFDSYQIRHTLITSFRCYKAQIDFTRFPNGRIKRKKTPAKFILQAFFMRAMLGAQNQ